MCNPSVLQVTCSDGCSDGCAIKSTAYMGYLKIALDFPLPGVLQIHKMHRVKCFIIPKNKHRRTCWHCNIGIGQCISTYVIGRNIQLHETSFTMYLQMQAAISPINQLPVGYVACWMQVLGAFTGQLSSSCNPAWVTGAGIDIYSYQHEQLHGTGNTPMPSMCKVVIFDDFSVLFPLDLQFFAASQAFWMRSSSLVSCFHEPRFCVQVPSTSFRDPLLSEFFMRSLSLQLSMSAGEHLLSSIKRRAFLPYALHT